MRRFALRSRLAPILAASVATASVLVSASAAALEPAWVPLLQGTGATTYRHLGPDCVEGPPTVGLCTTFFGEPESHGMPWYGDWVFFLSSPRSAGCYYSWGWNSDPQFGHTGWTGVLGMDACKVCPAGTRYDANYETVCLNGGCTPTLNERCVVEGVDPDLNAGDSCPSCGNPINPSVGNKFQAETDYVGAGEHPLQFARFYNSMDGVGHYRAAYGRVPASVGARWRHFYDRAVVVVGTTGAARLVVVERPDGKASRFRASSLDGPFVNASPLDMARLERTADGGFRFVTVDDDVETYDASGRLLTLAQRGGMSPQTVGYDDQGRVARVSDEAGRALVFAYDAQSRLATLTDPVGGVTSFAYGAASTLTAVSRPDSAVRTYLYGEPELTSGAPLPTALTGIVDEKGNRFASYGYDVSGRAITSEHAGGAGRVVLAYGAGATQVTDAAGQTRAYGFTNVGGKLVLSGVEGEACPTCGPKAVVRDARGFVASETDWRDVVTCTARDDRDRVLVRLEGLASCPVDLAAASIPSGSAARKTTTRWSAAWNLPEAEASPRKRVTMVYGAPDDSNPGSRGRLLRRTEEPTSDLSGEKGFAAVTTGPARTTTFSYDARGRIVAVDGPRSDVSDVTRITYHADDDADLARRGRVATLTNALGHVTRIDAYDGNGQPLVVVDPNGASTTYTYDARQRLVASSASGEVTTYGHDAAGLMTETVLPTGGRLRYGHDAAGRLVEVRDSLGDRVAYTLDAEGHRVLEEVFDPAGTLTERRRRGYDALGRQISETTGDATTSFTLDGEGNVIQTTDPLGRAATMTYDALGRAVATTLPPASASDGRPVSTVSVEPGGATAGFSDLRGLATTYEPDGFGAVTSTASPDTGTTRRSFDEAGNLVSSVDALGRVTTYAYDALGRVTKTTYGAATGPMLRTVDFGYDAGAFGKGRLTSVLETAADGTVLARTSFVHDARGRVVAETNEVGAPATTTYRYGATTGVLERMTYPSGRAVDFEVDAFGRVIKAKATSPDGTVQPLATGARYAPFGGLVGFSLGNGQPVDLPRDLQGRIRAYTLGSQRFDVGYDAAGRVTGLTNAADPASARAYAYDGLDRLVQALLPARTVSFEYDTNGNRTKRTSGATVEASTIDVASNRVLEVVGGAGVRFGYDAAGSMIVQGATTHAYDARGRLVSSTTGGVTTTYQVDARGRRVRKSGQRDTVFQYDTRGSLIAELSPVGATRREYYYLGDRMIAVMVQP